MKRTLLLVLFIMICAVDLPAQDEHIPNHIDSIISGYQFIPEKDKAINDYILELSRQKLHDEHNCFIALKNVNIVDAEHNKIKKHRTVIEHDGMIIKIGFNLFTSLRGAKVIDGEDLYLAPGLTDMHVHFTCTNRDRLIYLLYGITTIRNMSGSEFHLNDKYFIDNKEFLSPRLYTCGPDIAGYYDHLYADTAAIKKEVRKQMEDGYDFVKAGRYLSDTCFFAILEEAKCIGFTVAAELPKTINMNELMKYKDIITIEGFSGDISNKKIFQDNAKGSWHCPGMVSASDILKAKSIEGFSKKTESTIASNLQNRLLVNYIIDGYIKALTPVYRAKSSFYKLYVKAGGGILAGTESGTNLPMVIPGASLHDELKELQLLGLTPDQAILAATLNPAKILDHKNISGVIEEGKQADFLLLSDNPLEKIENYKKITGVMLNGTWLSSDDLKAIKNKLEEIK